MSNHAAILETIEALGETTLIADPSRIVELLKHLRENEGYVRLSGITAIDKLPAEPRFEVIYHLHKFDMKTGGNNHRLRVKCRVGGETPEIDSATPIWLGADWYEREVFDMFGISFRNHPNLVRILMPVDWDGHPLRKDYPVHGHKYGYTNK